MQAIIQQTMENLKRHHMNAVFVPTKDDLPQILEPYLNGGKTVTVGGSMTLFETGVMKYIDQRAQEKQIHLLDRYAEGLSREEVMEIYRATFTADIYITSSNAITADGFLYNVDGNGNRVAATIFGPKKVIVIAGINKIVLSQEAAVKRIQEIAAPKNAQRLNLKTPCAKTGTCSNCSSPDRICCSYTFLGPQRIHDRIEVILVGESYGY